MHRLALLLGMALAVAPASEAAAGGRGVGPSAPVPFHRAGSGMVGGAVAGGLLGRAIAGRRDNRAAILGGAALGGLAGSALLHQPPRSRDRAATGPVPERDRALAEFRRRQAAHALNLRRFRELQEAAPRP